MKKVVAMVLSLVMALGLMAGCGQKDSGSGSGVKTVESLKIAFSPYADADQITTATEPLEALLKAKLLEKGYDVQNIDMTVGTSYTAVGEALSAGSADIGFISGGNYVLFSDDCDVLLTALRYGINKDSENAADWNDVIYLPGSEDGDVQGLPSNVTDQLSGTTQTVGQDAPTRHGYTFDGYKVEGLDLSLIHI